MRDAGQRRAAAEQLEEGVARYAGGDLAGAAAAFERALELDAELERAAHFLAWVRDLQSGRRSLAEPEDETALELQGPDPAPAYAEQMARAVADALTAEGGMTSADRRPSETLDSGWGRPLEAATTNRIFTSAAALAEASSGEAGESDSVGRAETMLGLQVPVATLERSGGQAVEQPESVTREWRSVATGTNLPPLEVPELSEEHVSGLLALDALGIRTRGDREEGSVTRALPMAELASRGSRTIEFEAEYTPLPGSSARPDPVDAEVSEEAELPTTEFKLSSLDPEGFGDEQTNSAPRDRLVAGLQSRAEGNEPGSFPTSPFVPGDRLVLPETGGGEAPPVEDLPPGPPSEVPAAPAADPLALVRGALERGDVETALEAAERAVEAAGGLQAETLRPGRALLERVYEAFLGSLRRIPRHGVPSGELDPRAAFVLSRLDGAMSIEELLEVSGMARVEALRSLALLVRRGVVVLS